MSLIYVIEDEPIMAECIALAAENTTIAHDGSTPIRPEVMIFNDAVSAIESIDEETPDLILLDVLLSGPDGFAFLNELVSYQDTSRIPVALISSFDLSQHDLSHYGVFKVIHKSTMTPEDIQAAILEGFNLAQSASAPVEAEVITEPAVEKHPSALIDEVLGMPPADYSSSIENPAEPNNSSDQDAV